MLKKESSNEPTPLVLNKSVYRGIAEWMKKQSDYTEKSQLILASSECAHMSVLRYLKPNFDVGDGWYHVESVEHPCDYFPTYQNYSDKNPTYRTGAMRHSFQHTDGSTFAVIVLTVILNDADMNTLFRSFSLVPQAHINTWIAFEKECNRLATSAVHFRGKVYVVGGNENTFDTSVTWDEIFLAEKLKLDILHDIDAFFQRGVEIYQRLNIKPFRKLLLAGVPGTGKTMLCSALANWALEQQMFVVYVSGSSNSYGARFWKIHQALEMSASSESKTLVIVEELDAYMQDDDSKAELLNVLDGLESPSNPFGTIMIATTNHPEKIDDRVLKRPGRLDRIFIIPEMQDANSTETMLRKYMGDKWQDDHAQIVPDLIGKPGAFIREVALYALTMAAYREEAMVNLSFLQDSLNKLEEQIEAKDDFLTAHKRNEVGFTSKKKKSLMDF
jgi:SpoVK/Ycf46/Vps4 family AAA+-type ATPase